MKRIINLVMLAAVVGFAVWLYIDFTKAIDGKTFREWHSERSQAMREVQRSLRPISDIAKGDALFDQETVNKSTSRLHATAVKNPEWFVSVAPYGDAVEEIWAADSNFNELMDAFIKRAAAMAAKPPQSLEELRPMVDDIRQDCATCHRKFKD